MTKGFKWTMIMTVAMVIVVSVVLVLIPTWQIGSITEDMIEQLNEQYDEDFTLTWSNIETVENPEVFLATVRSEKTGIVYDVNVEKGKATIPYESENELMTKNKWVEEYITQDALAMVSDEGQKIRLLLAEAIDMTKLGQAYKEAFQIKSLIIETIQVDAESYETATEHIGYFYQRSTVPADAFEVYAPAIDSITL